MELLNINQMLEDKIDEFQDTIKDYKRIIRELDVEKV